MNNRKVIILTCVLFAVILTFFPYTNKMVLSGPGEIQTLEGDRVGTCTLTVEIYETRSLLFDYDKHFTYTINGETREKFATATSAEARDICMISQMYYDENENEMSLCSFIYPKDLSWGRLRTETAIYQIQGDS